MPEPFSIDELAERLRFIEEIEVGVRQADEGKGVPHDQVKQMEWKWAK